MLEFRCTVMRGGTSRALFFLKEDLPTDPQMLDRVACRAFGSPDPYGQQINGLGGPVTNMNKLAVISRREGEPNTVNYEFGQIEIGSWNISRRANCGNISSAVGPYAVDMGLVDEVEEPFTKVRIFNTNTKKYIHALVPVKDGKVVYEGDFSIPGVPGTGSKIRLDFMDPGGPTTGKLLPTGNVVDVTRTVDFGEFEYSFVDAANPFVFVRAEDIGMTAGELPADITKNDTAREKLMQIRDAVCVSQGWAKDPVDARANSPVAPKICFVGRAAQYIGTTGETFAADQMDILARMIEFGRPGNALALTGCIGLAVAAKIPGSIVSQMVTEQIRQGEQIRIGHASGVVPVGMDVVCENGAYRAISGTVYRTARKMMSGSVYVIL